MKCKQQRPDEMHDKSREHQQQLALEHSLRHCLAYLKSILDLSVAVVDGFIRTRFESKCYCTPYNKDLIMQDTSF